MRMLSPFVTRDVWDDFDSIVENIFRPAFNARANFQPSYDIKETKDHYLVTFDMPGVKKEDISIEVKDNQLSIRGERRHERSFGKFERTFALPSNVDTEKVEANYEDGVLNVALPKAQAAKGRTIEIQSGKSGFFSKLLGGKEGKEESESKLKDVKVS
jgi:HSP20 family protein